MKFNGKNNLYKRKNPGNENTNVNSTYSNWANKNPRIKILLSVLIVLSCMVFVFAFFNRDRLSSNNIVSWICEDIFGFGGGQGYPIDIDGTIVENNNFKIMNKNIAMVSDISFTSFNKNGKRVVSQQHSFASPKLKVNGNRAIIYNVGGKGIQIEYGKSTVYKGTLEKDIIASAISERGNYVVACESNGYLSEMTLYSEKNEEKYKYYFSEYYITDVAINKKGNYVVASGISSENGNLKSAIYIFDFKTETPRSVFEYNDNMIFSVSFLTENNIAAVGDKNIVFFNVSKGELNNFSYDNRVLRCFKNYYNGGSVISLSLTEDGRNCSVISFGTKGNQKLNLDTEFKIKDVALKNKSVAVLESDTIHRYNLKGEKKGEHFIGDDSKQIELLSQHAAYVLGVSEIYKIHI